MVKCLLSFLCIFLILTVSAFAYSRKDRELDNLTQEYGQNLNQHIPFYIRFSFAKHTGIDWSESDFSDRKNFLINYEETLAAEDAREAAEAKAEAYKEKQREIAKRQLERQIAAELREERAEERATDKYYKDRQKQFDRMVKEQEKELAGMENQAQQQQQQAAQQAQEAADNNSH